MNNENIIAQSTCTNTKKIFASRSNACEECNIKFTKCTYYYKQHE